MLENTPATTAAAPIEVPIEQRREVLAIHIRYSHTIHGGPPTLQAASLEANNFEAFMKTCIAERYGNATIEFYGAMHHDRYHFHLLAKDSGILSDKAKTLIEDEIKHIFFELVDLHYPKKS